MQRTAQDWLVLTQLTEQNATAVGIVMALQFGRRCCCCRSPATPPTISTGVNCCIADAGRHGPAGPGARAADRQRAVVWHVYSSPCCRLRGRVRCPGAADLRLRSGRRTYLSNAVALNSRRSTWRACRPGGGRLIDSGCGTGWVFLLNAAVVCRGARLAEHAAVGELHATRAPSAARPPARRLPLRLGSAGPESDPGCCS